MSLPPKLNTTFLPSELFYLSEDSLITVTSHISLSPISLIGLSTPRLRPGRNAAIPLWLAVILKKQSKCAIMLPKWMNENSLKEVYEQEVKDLSRFCEKLPKDWLEISQTLLDVARDDLRAPAHTIRNLLRDIREARQAKARSGIKELNESHMRMDNLGTLELNELRPFVAMVMDEIGRIVATMEDGEGNGVSSSEDEDEDDDGGDNGEGYGGDPIDPLDPDNSNDNFDNIDFNAIMNNSNNTKNKDNDNSQGHLPSSLNKESQPNQESHQNKNSQLDQATQSQELESSQQALQSHSPAQPNPLKRTLNVGYKSPANDDHNSKVQKLDQEEELMTMQKNQTTTTTAKNNIIKVERHTESGNEEEEYDGGD